MMQLAGRDQALDHPNQQIIELTPRVWKEKFTANPLTSDLEIAA